MGDGMQSEELEIIDQCLDKHYHILDTLNSRHQRIKNILDIYNPHKNLTQTLSALEQMNNIGVTHDIIRALFTEDAPFVKYLSMKQCQQLLPKARELMDSKTGYFVKVGIECILNTLKHIGNEIINMQMPVQRGVDLAREERMESRDAVLEMFRHIFKSPNLIKYKDKESALQQDFK